MSVLFRGTHISRGTHSRVMTDTSLRLGSVESSVVTHKMMKTGYFLFIFIQGSIFEGVLLLDF